jgi:hypothetical protein
MPTQLKQVISSFLTWSAYEKLAMSMTWQISPGAVLLQLPYTTQSALECSWVFLVAVFSKDGVLESEWGLFTPHSFLTRLLDATQVNGQPYVPAALPPANKPGALLVKAESAHIVGVEILKNRKIAHSCRDSKPGPYIP